MAKDCKVPTTIHQYKVASLPNSLEPNAIYYVKGVNDDFAVAYITDRNGVATPIVTQEPPIPSGDKNFVYSHQTSILEFVVHHGLNKLVSVTMIDNNNNLCTGSFEYYSEDELNKVKFKLDSYFYGRIIFN